MRLSTPTRIAAVVLTAALLGSPASAEPGTPADNPLDGFEHVIGGTWVTDGSEHTFEWGPGRKYVVASTYFIGESGERELVGQGFWYWDPAAETIKGISLAIDMPFHVMEMRTRFEGHRLISDLTTIGEDGALGTYVETWDFTGPDTYAWSLHEGNLETPVMMSDTYTRR
jgi:hypothetical protein